MTFMCCAAESGSSGAEPQHRERLRDVCLQLLRRRDVGLAARAVALARLREAPSVQRARGILVERQRSIEIGDFATDYSKITATLGWTPKTSLRDGLRETLRYYGQNLRHYV